MQSKNLHSEITSLEFQVLYQEKKLDKAFADNLELKETKKIYHELKLLKERLAGLSELYKPNPSSM